MNVFSLSLSRFVCVFGEYRQMISWIENGDPNDRAGDRIGVVGSFSHSTSVCMGISAVNSINLQALNATIEDTCRIACNIKHIDEMVKWRIPYTIY